MRDFVDHFYGPPNAPSEMGARVKQGIQCPECFGVRIDPRTTRFDASPVGFLCTECGCQFGSR
jgi:hypothetical protein